MTVSILFFSFPSIHCLYYFIYTKSNKNTNTRNPRQRMWQLSILLFFRFESEGRTRRSCVVLGVVIVGEFSGLKVIGTWVCISDRKVRFLLVFGFVRAVVCVPIQFRFGLGLSYVGSSVAIRVGERVRSDFGFGRASRNIVLVRLFGFDLSSQRYSFKSSLCFTEFDI